VELFGRKCGDVLTDAMIYRFAACSLDTGTFELRRDGQPVAIEPQVFELLRLLIDKRHRVVTKDELIEMVWHGRIVSDAAVSSRIKAARQAVGDSGEAQRLIQTVPKIGYRFVADVELGVLPSAAAVASADTIDQPEALANNRPSIAILPFATTSGSDLELALCEAVPQDVVSALARLRWLFVIARASSFQLRDALATAANARTMLGVRYCLFGQVMQAGKMLSIAVELCDTESDGIIWADRYETRLDGLHELRERIIQSIVIALDLQIPLHEAQRTRLTHSEHLDAWSAYHRGLRYLYRFDREGNEAATRLFRKATQLDPGFARAYAGLSFVHFEDAFLRLNETRDESAYWARANADKAMELDPLDPLCNLVMGRVFWLDEDLDQSLAWLDRAIQLNPNYAQATYSRAWTESLLGFGDRSEAGADLALRLSPLDPLVYGMLGVRAFSHMVRGETALAVEWSEKAARAPGAHPLIDLIAAVGRGMQGDDEIGRAWFLSARKRNRALETHDFLKAFPFRDSALRSKITGVLDRLAG